MVKPIGCPLKPKSACPRKRLVQKRRPKTVSSTSSSSTVRLTSEEMQEMRRLSQILPTGMRASNPQNDPLLLINNATHYINQLTSTLLARVQNGSLSQDVLKNLPASVLNAHRQRSKARKTTQKEPKTSK